MGLERHSTAEVGTGLGRKRERCEDLQLPYLLPWQEWLQELVLVYSN